MAGQSFQGNKTKNVEEIKRKRQRNTWGYLYSPVKQKPEWAMNVRCHTEYSAYNDLEAHNGTPHMTHEQILKFTILKGVLFPKVQYFPYVTFSEYICVQCQSKLLINIAKYC